MRERSISTAMPLHEDIFEEMRQRLGCAYISDIRYLDSEYVMRSFSALPDQAYSREARRDFVNYVHGE